ncbi:hypothetical protein LC612_39650 [Nostoc sp. CHAB 5834]|nr:hypothetical protein [Nostoc sp. CHAB 5834]
MYSVKNYKNFKGRNGEPCAQGTLHDAKGKIADWSDSASGGPFDVRFSNRDAQAPFVGYAKEFLAKRKDFSGNPFDVSVMADHEITETAVQHMSYDYGQRLEDQKQAKKGIAYYRPDLEYPDGKALYVTTRPYTASNVELLRKECPDILEIVNETLGMPLLDEAKAALDAQNKRLKPLCKTNMVFTVRAPDGKIVEMKSKAAYNTLNAVKLRASRQDIVEIINERFL